MFDRYVSAQDKHSTARQVLIVGSIVVHALVLAGLVVYSFFHVEEVAPPNVQVTFFSAAAPRALPPPPPPPAAGHKKPNTTPKIKPPIVQPTEAPKELVQPKEPEPQEEDEGEGEGDDSNARPCGGPGQPPCGPPCGKPGQPPCGPPCGGPGEPPCGPPCGGPGQPPCGPPCGGPGQPPCGNAPLPPVKPKNVPPHYLDNSVLHRVDPHLPDVVKIQRRGTGEATFRAKVCISRAGDVSDVIVITSIPGADASIVSTIREWKYKPQPIPVCFIADWIFSIE